MKKPKIIEKKLLLQLMAQLRKYYKAESNSEEENAAYEEWRTLCEKAFGDLTLSRRANQLKDLTRDLRDFKNETVIKVFQALGYVVVDNVADYLRKQQDDLEQEIYNEMCRGCSKENLCHEECEHCEEYYKALEKKGIRKY